MMNDMVYTLMKIKEKVQEWILANSNNLSLKFEAEDRTAEATMDDLQRAIALANEKELENFLEGNLDGKKHFIYFEDGYLVVEVLEDVGKTSLEMFTLKLDEALEARKALTKELESISCELADKRIICNDVNLLKAFAKFHNLKLEKRDIEPHPLRDSFYYVLKYKDIRIIAYPIASPMEQRMRAYASKFIGEAV